VGLRSGRSLPELLRRYLQRRIFSPVRDDIGIPLNRKRRDHNEAFAEEKGHVS
jgi:hypothetical protein